MNIYGTNLNLFVTFHALVEEGSVTRAARRLGLSQPAVSNALAQLRAIMDDPLFVRTRYGITPTPRALALAGTVRAGLAQLDAALGAPAAFDPKTATRTFVIATDDYVEYVLVPPLVRRLSREAPGVSIELRHWGNHFVPEELRTGGVDLMIGYYADVPPGHEQQKLFRESYACIVRKGHPIVGKKLTLDAYVKLAHVLVSQRGGVPGEVDVALAKRGYERRVGLRVSHFLLVPKIVAESDMVAALSRRVAEPFAKLLPLRIFEPPIALSQSRVGQVWHSRVTSDPAHAWLRGAIAEIASRV